MDLPKRLFKEEGASLTNYLIPACVVYLSETELSEILSCYLVFVSVSEQEVQNFLGAYFRYSEDFPQSDCCSDVILGGLLFGGHEDCVFEANGEVFLKIVKGGWIHLGLAPCLGVTLWLL